MWGALWGALQLFVWFFQKLQLTIKKKSPMDNRHLVPVELEQLKTTCWFTHCHNVHLLLEIYMLDSLQQVLWSSLQQWKNSFWSKNSIWLNMCIKQEKYWSHIMVKWQQKEIIYCDIMATKESTCWSWVQTQ